MYNISSLSFSELVSQNRQQLLFCYRFLALKEKHDIKAIYDSERILFSCSEVGFVPSKNISIPLWWMFSLVNWPFSDWQKKPWVSQNEWRRPIIHNICAGFRAGWILFSSFSLKIKWFFLDNSPIWGEIVLLAKKKK